MVEGSIAYVERSLIGATIIVIVLLRSHQHSRRILVRAKNCSELRQAGATVKDFRMGRNYAGVYIEPIAFMPIYTLTSVRQIALQY